MFDTLTTDRLLIRPFRMEDSAGLHARRNHPDVARYQDWVLPFTRERADRLVAELVAMDGPTVGEWWMAIIADPDDTTVLGDVAVNLTWDGRCAEIGYSLDRRHWGHGYASEAAGAVVDALFRASDVVTRVEGRLHPDNPASAMVLERVGMRFEGRTRLSF